MEYSVTLIPGDGIGPEIVAEAQKVLNCVGCWIRWRRFTATVSGTRRSLWAAAPSMHTEFL